MLDVAHGRVTSVHDKATRHVLYQCVLLEHRYDMLPSLHMLSISTPYAPGDSAPPSSKRTGGVSRHEVVDVIYTLAEIDTDAARGLQTILRLCLYGLMKEGGLPNAQYKDRCIESIKQYVRIDMENISKLPAFVRDIREVALAAVDANGLALQHIGYDLWHDKEIVLRAVKQNGMALLHAFVEMREDKDVVLAAVAQNGLALQYASSVLKDDKDVVLAAVNQNAMALEYVAQGYQSSNLMGDRDVVLAALRGNKDALKFVCYNSLSPQDREYILDEVPSLRTHL